MSLRGQGGYAMAALLVALAVMSVLMSAALPVWRQEARREREEELVFRGQQYVRAIRLYNMRTQTLPPSFDALVQGHFIRKKYKDPITNDDFDPIPAGAVGQPGIQPGAQQPGQPGRGGAASATPQPAFTSQPSGAFSASSGAVPGGMIGVRSKSKDQSIRLYLGRNHYNEWTFLYVQQQPGGAGRGQPGGPGGRGGPGGGPGNRGRGPDGRPGFPPIGGPPRGGPGGNPFPFPTVPGPGRGGRGPGGL